MYFPQSKPLLSVLPDRLEVIQSHCLQKYIFCKMMWCIGFGVIWMAQNPLSSLTYHHSLLSNQKEMAAPISEFPAKT